MGAYWMCWTHGCRKSVTSNLHGGGQAIAMNRLMKQWIEDDDLRAEINTTAETFGIDVASFLEDTYGDLCGWHWIWRLTEADVSTCLKLIPNLRVKYSLASGSGISIIKPSLNRWSTPYGYIAINLPECPKSQPFPSPFRKNPPE